MTKKVSYLEGHQSVSTLPGTIVAPNDENQYREGSIVTEALKANSSEASPAVSWTLCHSIFSTYCNLLTFREIETHYNTGHLSLERTACAAGGCSN